MKYHSVTYYLLLMHAVKAVVRVSAVAEAPVAALLSQHPQHKADISDPVPPPLRDHIVPRSVRTDHNQGRCTTSRGPASTLSREPLRAWRCLLCGEVLDPTIAQHRKGPPKPPPRKPTPRHDTMVVVVGPANQWNKS